jgi:mannose-1-phosphate guanylyltransferase
MSQIRPVIICGGAGSRLWPVSREAKPKQFSDLPGGQSTSNVSLCLGDGSL